MTMAVEGNIEAVEASITALEIQTPQEDGNDGLLVRSKRSMVLINNIAAHK